MTTRVRIAPLLVLFLCGSAARAGVVTGSLDGGASRADDWSPGARSSGVMPLDFGGNLALMTSLLKPGLADLSLSGDYRQVRNGRSNSGNATDNFGFRSNISLLGGMPLTLGGFAARSWTDFSSNLSTGDLGSARTTVIGGNAAFALPDLPRARVSIVRSLSDAVSGDQTTFTGSTNLAAGLDYTAGRNALSIDYQTGWNNGTLFTSDYRSHTVTAQAWSNPAAGYVFSLAERYNLRLPTNDNLGNPRFESSNLTGHASLAAQSKIGGDITIGQQSQRLSSPSGLDTEFRVTSINGLVRRTVAEGLDLSVGLGGNYAEEREQATSVRSENFIVSASAGWSRRSGSLSLGLQGGGGVGMTRQLGGDSAGSYTFQANGRAGWDEGAAAGGLTYGFNYGSNINGLGAYSWGQTANASLSFNHRAGRTSSLQFDLSDNHNQDELIGTSRDLRLTLTGQFTIDVVSIGLNAGITDGVEDRLGLAQSLDGSIPLAPQSLNRQSSFIGTNIGASFGRSSVQLNARIARVRDPGALSPVTEEAFGLNYNYAIGLFLLTVQDTLVNSARDGSHGTSNWFAVRISRKFGVKW